MRMPVEDGTILRLYEVGSKRECSFTVESCIGMGGSCIVYTAFCTDSEGNRYPVRLKELYPEWLDLERQGEALFVPDEKSDAFADAVQKFTDGYQKQMRFRELPESMNSIANIQGIYEGGGTKYIAMSCQNAVPLSLDMSLYDIFRVIRAVTLQIANFHDNGYLYLDLKPQNVMLYPETPEMVMLFDFDSAVPMSDMQPAHLSCTDAWAAPEILQRRYGDVAAETDIYGIGALMLYLLFHRKPRSSDRRRGASWDEEIKDSILKTEKPEIRRAVSQMLLHTLSADPKRRWAACDDLLEVIEPLVSEYQKPKPYLKTLIPTGNHYFCGRDHEIDAIHKELAENGRLVLHGIGGIGKSELAKHYALQYSKDYDAAVFVRFQGNIQDTIIHDDTFPIIHCKADADEAPSAYYQRKLQILHEICTERHLIIIDNFDVDACEELDRLLDLPCKLLFTSRVDQSDVFPQLEIDILEDMEHMRDIFRHYTQAEPDPHTDDIIYALDGHTMGIEIVARQMKITGINAAEMYERLTENGISATSEKIRNFKDGSLRQQSARSHLKILFHVFGLPDEQKSILSYFSMIGTTPVTREHLTTLCEFDDEELQEVDLAVHGGWIQLYQDTYQLHPLICEVLLDQLQPDIKSVWILIRHLIEDSEEKLLQNMNAEQRYRQEAIMFHAAKHIYGEPAILVGFLKEMEKVFADYGKYDKAEQTLLRRMELADEVWQDDTSEFVFEYFELADYAKEQGAFERAEHYRQIAMERLPEADRIDVAYHLASDDEDYEAAKGYALALLKQAKTDEEYYEAYSYLANTEDDIGDAPEQVIAYAEKAYYYARLRIENTISDETENVFDLWKNAGEAAKMAHQFFDAVECYQKALANISSKEDPTEILLVKINLATSYAAVDEKHKALELLEECEEFVKAHYLPQHPKFAECILELVLTGCHGVFSASLHRVFGQNP